MLFFTWTSILKHMTIYSYELKQKSFSMESLKNITENSFDHISICQKHSVTLFTFLMKGTRTWILMSLRLIAFVLILIPGWISLLRYYLFDVNVIKNIEYGKGIKYRNVLDVYKPHNSCARKSPTIVFVGGGAWIIGYKLWSSLCGRVLSQQNFTVVIPDYRNFPQGNLIDMESDLMACLQWVIINIDQYGGDPNNIILTGQSAGAHIGMYTLLELFQNSRVCSSVCSRGVNEEDANNGAFITDSNGSFMCSFCSIKHNHFSFLRNAGASASASASDVLRRIRLFIGISGAYDLEGLSAHLHSRGLDASILSWICDGDLVRYSPTLRIPVIADDVASTCKASITAPRFDETGGLLNGCVADQACKPFLRFPPVLLLHGSSDRSIPPSASVDLAKALLSAGGSATVQLYDGWSHTYAVLEGPLSGDHRLVEDMISGITKALGQAPGMKAESIHTCTPLAPRWLVRCAQSVNPF